MTPIRDEVGGWKYPADWTPEQRDQWQAVADDLASEERRLAKVEADLKAAAQSPAAFIAAQRARLAEAKRAREAAETEAADDVKWASFVEKHGEGRLRRVYTELGSYILRGMTDAETSQTDVRVQSVTAAALEAGDETRAARDAVKVYQDAILTKAVLHPAPAKAKEIAAALPGVWPDLYQARDELNRGRRVALGKGAAR